MKLINLHDIYSVNIFTSQFYMKCFWRFVIFKMRDYFAKLELRRMQRWKWLDFEIRAKNLLRACCYFWLDFTIFLVSWHVIYEQQLMIYQPLKLLEFFNKSLLLLKTSWYSIFAHLAKWLTLPSNAPISDPI